MRVAQLCQLNYLITDQLMQYSAYGDLHANLLPLTCRHTRTIQMAKRKEMESIMLAALKEIMKLIEAEEAKTATPLASDRPSKKPRLMKSEETATVKSEPLKSERSLPAELPVQEQSLNCTVDRCGVKLDTKEELLLHLFLDHSLFGCPLANCNVSYETE